MSDTLVDDNQAWDDLMTMRHVVPVVQTVLRIVMSRPKISWVVLHIAIEYLSEVPLTVPAGTS